MKPANTARTQRKQAGTNPAARIETEIDQILAAEDELIPSSGFTASVMERVKEEAAAPPPIPFPWMRALPGILLTIGVLGWCFVELVRLVQTAPESHSLTLPHLSAMLTGPAEQAGWVALSLCLSLLCWLFARRLAGRGGLL